ncbi:unnamed protein product [Caenorhabditis sp. 36 PRJEB53466]|nr:unnamed protein product [Caenorhabditis sp. 36 PRJEB53466]
MENSQNSIARKKPVFVITSKSQSTSTSQGVDGSFPSYISSFKYIGSTFEICSDMDASFRPTKMDLDSDAQERNGTSEIMSVQSQIVRFTANSSPNHYEREAALVIRLEQELTQSQLCNHRLNQQLKTLANSSDKAIKTELASTKVEYL